MKLLDLYRRAAAISGRTLFSVLSEAVRLRLSSNRLGLTEYIDFRLFERDLTFLQKKSFAGQRMQAAAEEILVDDYSKFIGLDKVTMYALLAGLELPAPRIRATYRSLRPAALNQLTTKADLVDFLNRPGNLPVYIKRAFGAYGRGNVLVSDVRGGCVVLGNGVLEPIEQFVDSLDDGRSLGWLLQEPLESHSRIKALTGSSKISGVRIHTFMGLRQPKVLKAVFKINAGLRDSDNFEHGASGNMLAAVDLHSGRVVRAIAGTGLNQENILISPVSGASLIGFELPHWKETVSLVLNAQRAVPGFLCPGWDIALCGDGPKILEVNAFGDLDLPQHAFRQSFFDDEFLACLRERGLDDLLWNFRGQSRRSPINSRIGVRRHHWMW